MTKLKKKIILEINIWNKYKLNVALVTYKVNI